MTSSWPVSTAVFAALLAACGGGDPAIPATPDGGTVSPSQLSASDVPIDGATPEQIAAFDDGDRLFDLPFREADGLGPLYVRSSCGACHEGAARGPGLVRKMSVVAEDGVTAAADQSLLPYGPTVREGLAAGAVTPIEPPADPRVRLSIRLGPPVLGRGFVEAVADAEILRVQAEQAARSDGIHGRANLVADGVGRFGDKARIATVDGFVADALQGDMGLTTPRRPEELPNPDGLKDDLRPGVDLDLHHVERIAAYVRLIAIPARVLPERGAALFERAKCGVCHVPALHTRTDARVPQLADVDAPIYSDLLLHDMGDALADGVAEGAARGRDWKTTPLIGVRFSKTYLHDGRARSVEDAIRAHGGEAQTSVDAFGALPDDERRALLAFVEAL